MMLGYTFPVIVSAPIADVLEVFFSNFHQTVLSGCSSPPLPPLPSPNPLTCTSLVKPAVKLANAEVARGSGEADLSGLWYSVHACRDGLADLRTCCILPAMLRPSVYARLFLTIDNVTLQAASRPLPPGFSTPPTRSPPPGFDLPVSLQPPQESRPRVSKSSVLRLSCDFWS